MTLIDLSLTPSLHDHMYLVLTSTQILSNDIDPVQPPNPPSLRTRVDSLCSLTGRLDDTTLKFIRADLLATGLGFKPEDGENSQTCQICIQGRLIIVEPEGVRRTSEDKEEKEETKRD